MDRIGERAGPYEIVERVTVPEPGVWHRARDLRRPTEPFVGGPHPEPSVDVGATPLLRFAASDGTRERGAIARQRAVLARLDDPRIPRLVDEAPKDVLAIGGGTGATLAHAIANRVDETIVMTPATLLDLVLEVGRALAHAHDRDVVHGHLDPSGVVLDRRGQVWVYGFGNPDAPRERWMAPEQARGGSTGPATDQWAVGALALGLVSGEAPWRGGDPSGEAAVGDLSRAVIAVEGQWAELGAVLRRMVHPTPARRFPSLGQACDALEALAALAHPRSARQALATALAALADPAGAEARPAPRAAAPPPGPSPTSARGPAVPTAVPTTSSDRSSSSSYPAAPSSPSSPSAPPRSPRSPRSPSTAADRSEPSEPSEPSAGASAERSVEPTDAGLDGGLAGEWFDSPVPGPVARAPRAKPLPLPSPTADLSLASDAPPYVARRPAADPLIVKVAPVLAAGMVFMLVVWLIVRLT